MDHKTQKSEQQFLSKKYIWAQINGQIQFVHLTLLWS